MERPEPMSTFGRKEKSLQEIESRIVKSIALGTIPNTLWLQGQATGCFRTE
jgi:hypothetical protein